MKPKTNSKEVNSIPLCVFSLSSPFTIHDYNSILNQTSRRSSSPCRRRNNLSLPKVIPRFKPIRRRYSHNLLTKYLTGQVKNRNKENLTLQEVLKTIKSVWNSSDSIFNSFCSLNMDNLIKKKSSASSELHSPILFRRRLSAPETIMRKHTLAQQRSDSHDSDSLHGYDAQSSQWRTDKAAGSDPNLNKKRDYNLMRKSTLLRRLWGSTKPLSERSNKFPTTYYEWQYGKVLHDKSTHSTYSNHSSPERTKNRIRNSVSEEIKLSPTHKCNKTENQNNFRYQIEKLREPINSNYYQNSNCKNLMLHKNVDVQNNEFKMCSEYSQTSFEVLSSCESRLSTTKNSTTDLDTEQYTTRSTSTGSTTCTTTFSENSETTYKSSNFSTNDTLTNTYSSEMFFEENDHNKNNENAYLDIQGNDITSLKRSNNESYTILDNFNDSSTQTIDATNVNVISNVQLSQSTLNLIFNKVMQDVEESNVNISTAKENNPLESNIDINESITQSKLIQVQQVPSFYLNQTDDNPQHVKQQRILKYMVSNIGTGSPYTKPLENQIVVPRYSALPQTTSMEVNISSGESSDRESDKISLMDSLEDENSPRFNINKSNKFDEKPVRGELSPLLPDNSEDKFEKTELKSAAFYIPIESNAVNEPKSVADHLPEKVKERLHKRQLKREQKLKVTKDTIGSSKSDSNYVSASDNGNCPLDSSRLVSSTTLPDINSNKIKRKIKTTLPNIKSVRKIKMETDIQQFQTKKSNKSIKRKIENKTQNSNAQELKNLKKHESLLSKTRHKLLEPLNSVYSSKNYVYDVMPKRILHKTQVNNFDKRIEILEIVECVGSNSDSSQRSKSKKSKIPVLVNSKLPNILKEDRNQKPIYLEFDQIHEDDPKVDQLIANILIDALNRPDTQGSLERISQKQTTSIINICENRPLPVNVLQARHHGSKYQQRFESIPEERSICLQSSIENISNNNRDVMSSLIKPQEESTFSKRQAKTNSQGIKQSNKEKAASDDNSKIPKGWITFYSIHKSQGSSESTSDEGTKSNTDKEIKNYNDENNEGSSYKKPDDNFENRTAENFKHPKSTSKNQMASNNNQVSSKQRSISQDSVDTWTSSDQEKFKRALPASVLAYRNQQRKERYKNNDSSSNKSMPHGWTVTVTGSTSNGQYVPELEMHLKFPSNRAQNNPASQSDSGFGEDNLNEKRENLPYIMPSKENHSKPRVSTTENVQKTQQLPKIVRHKSSNKLRQNENVYPICDSVEPRQTKTSSRRLLLNRPRTFIPPNDFFDDDLNDQSFQDILKKFPEILKIRGNAISPERKPKVSTMTERDVTRHIF